MLSKIIKFLKWDIPGGIELDKPKTPKEDKVFTSNAKVRFLPNLPKRPQVYNVSGSLGALPSNGGNRYEDYISEYLDRTIQYSEHVDKRSDDMSKYLIDMRIKQTRDREIMYLGKSRRIISSKNPSEISEISENRFTFTLNNVGFIAKLKYEVNGEMLVSYELDEDSEHYDSTINELSFLKSHSILSAIKIESRGLEYVENITNIIAKKDKIRMIPYIDDCLFDLKDNYDASVSALYIHENKPQNLTVEPGVVIYYRFKSEYRGRAFQVNQDVLKTLLEITGRIKDIDDTISVGLDFREANAAYIRIDM